MERLAKAFESLGFRNVKTLLASGNVLFEARPTNPAKLVRKIEDKLTRTFGHETSAIVRTIEELRSLADSNPFKGIKVTPRRTHLFVTFLAEKPRTKLEIPYESPDKSFRIISVSEHEVCSVLTVGPQWAKNLRQMNILEKGFGKKVTTRTWNTVGRVLKAGTPE
jgi:uncharacterized protein (DUF1697 family)